MQVSQDCVHCDDGTEIRDRRYFQCKMTKILLIVFSFLKINSALDILHLVIPQFAKLRGDRLRTKLVAAGVTMVMNDVLKVRGGNDYNMPHANKQKLEAKGNLKGEIMAPMWFVMQACEKIWEFSLNLEMQTKH